MEEEIAGGGGNPAGGRTSWAGLVVTVVLLLLIAGWWVFRGVGARETLDLMQRFDSAEKRPSPASFTVLEATLEGETKRAIAPHSGPGTRIVFKEKIPEEAWLSVSVGLQPAAWEAEGDGVLFMVLAAAGEGSEELFSQHVNPADVPADRRWIPVMVDLSSYAGEEVSLIFNTYASPPRKPVDTRNDLALWGEPQLIVR